MKQFTTAILLLLVLHGFSQVEKTIEFSIDKKTDCSRIAWVDGNKFAVISDRHNARGRRFIHFISVYYGDSLLRKGEKIVTGYSLDHNYTIVLGKKIFFCDTKGTDMGDYIFNIVDVVNESGKSNKNAIRIFDIWAGSEKEKLTMRMPGSKYSLDEERYNFVAYEGVNRQRALLTYNNRYSNPYPEGFLFRVLNEDAVLGPIDTLKLPYADPECNIDDVIYDDSAEKIYLICDLFKQGRVFEKSFLACYDLKSRAYSELKSSIPSFYKNKIQHMVRKDTIIYASLQASFNNPDHWTSTFMVVKKNPLEVTEIKSTDLKAGTVAGFFRGKREAIGTDFIIPANEINEYRKNCYSVGWINSYPLDLIDEKESHSGSGLAPNNSEGIVISASLRDTSSDLNFTGNALWLTYESDSYQPVQNMSDYHLRSPHDRHEPAFTKSLDKYSLCSYTSFTDKENLFSICNKLNSGDKRYSSVNIEKMEGEDRSEKPAIAAIIEKFNINTIQTRSLYHTNGISYIIGEYDPDNDPGDTAIFIQKKYFLIPLN